ncbi:MAG: LysM domain-containing protein [Candidatus Scalindua sp. AMX11]|nr:MAG: LysM domain-containing protein [Candidatus Scalindua sp.]NOG84217.1 LysM domain-containing protein [Planctomycetota bacterium]RZV64239.1 MAG: LysM domain-containing protein [Candidatus Scalindua sp. SCAELEC01]TDE63423.1 MAG: LysM domain-containing protein [Candidatus Scalindua sp. AMX11]GJQ57331.1 MAG: hypothetical protein SCALA701_01320 [Candidatus Scalindua sp.]
MIDPLQAILQPGSLKTTTFPPTSRYHSIDTVTMETETGKTIVYLRRRFVPSAANFAPIQEHSVTDADRLDNVANQYLGDPEQFWRLCDANNVIRPNELVETIGNKIIITLPEGIPGYTNA